MNTHVRILPEDAKNQSSIDRILALPPSLAEREQIFNKGLKEIQRQGLISRGVTIVPRLNEIKLGFVSAIGRYEYREAITDPKRAVAALKANPNWFAADGVYYGNGKITIYATATSIGTKLTVAASSLLERRLRSGVSFNLKLTAIENVIQTIAHEIAHHEGLDHGDVSLYNKEYFAIQAYRSQR